MWNARIRIQKNMAYRVDFFIGLAISVANASVGPLLQYFIFTNTKGYPGWNLKQIILFQGMVLIFSGIRGLLFGNVGGNVSSMVWKGEFDRLLIMPFKPIKIILASGFDLSSIGVLMTGIGLVIWSGITLKIKVFLLQVLLVCTGIFCGLLFYLAFIVFYSTMMIMVIRVNRVEELINTLFNFAGYPAEIFSRFTRVILTTIFPFMIAAYFPSQVLLGRATVVIAPGIAACFLLFSLSILFWNIKLKRYTSAGG